MMEGGDHGGRDHGGRDHGGRGSWREGIMVEGEEGESNMNMRLQKINRVVPSLSQGTLHPSN